MRAQARKAAARPAAVPVDLDQIFPFHVAFGPDLVVSGVGPSLAGVAPDVRPGVPFADVFAVRRPVGEISVPWLRRNVASLFLVAHRASGLLLRGQVIAGDERAGFLLLCSPWLAEPAQLQQFGLALNDFAIHDPTIDVIHVAQAQLTALHEAKHLAEQLAGQSAELRVANEELARQNAALREAQERLREQEAEARKLAVIAARTDNAVILTDVAGRIEWVNDGFVRMTGYSLADVAGRAPGDLLQGPETDPETVRFMAKRLAEGEGYNVELVNYARGGRRYWVSIEVQPIRDEAGAITNYMAIEADITERKQSEEVAEAFRKCAQMSFDPLYMVSPEDGFRFIYLNDAACVFFGSPRHELIGRPVADLSPGLDLGRLALADDAITTGRPIVFEANVRHADGRLIPVETSANLVQLFGRTFVFGWFRDVSERKQLEAAVIEVSTHEQHRIGHDLHDGLGSYLGGISFKVKMLEQELRSTSPPLADKAAEVVTLIAGGMGEVRRLARGLDPVDVERFGFAKALEKFAAEATEARQVHCSFRSSPAEPAVDLGVARELYRITQEALNNAVRHGQAKNFSIALDVDAETLVLVLVDDGKGFEYDGAPGRDPAAGLGLRIMQYRARAAGAELTIRTAPGKGTEIRCVRHLAQPAGETSITGGAS